MSMTQKKWTHLRDGLDWTWSVAPKIDVVSTIELWRWVGLAVHVTEIMRMLNLTSRVCLIPGYLFVGIEISMVGNFAKLWKRLRC